MQLQNLLNIAVLNHHVYTFFSENVQEFPWRMRNDLEKNKHFLVQIWFYKHTYNVWNPAIPISYCTLWFLLNFIKQKRGLMQFQNSFTPFCCFTDQSMSFLFFLSFCGSYFVHCPFSVPVQLIRVQFISLFIES